MKALIRKTFASALAAIFILVAIPSSATSVDSLKIKKSENELGLTSAEYEDVLSLLEDDFSDDATDSTVYEIYDENDQLIASRTILTGADINDKEFNLLKARSDFFMEIGNTSIYRLVKN